MNKQILSPKFLTLCFLILIASFSRLLTNHYQIWNFNAVVAIALFAGAKFSDKKMAFIVPAITMLVTDLALHLSPASYVYGTFVLIVLIGFTLHKHSGIIRLFFTVLGSSVLFYLITNFIVWPGNPLYAQNFRGLIDSYVAGLYFYNHQSFFVNQVLGDLFYTGILFGSWELITQRYPKLVKA